MNRLNTYKSWIGIATVSMIAVSCSTSPKYSFNTDLENDLKQRKPIPSRVGEGDGVHLSEAIQKNLKKDAISQQELPVLNFIASINRGKKKKNSKQDHYQECLNRFSQSPHCVFLKPSWSESWFDDEDDVDDDDDTDTQVALISTRSTSAAITTVPQTKSSKRKHAKVVESLVKAIRAGKFDTLAAQDQWEGDYFRVFTKFKQWSPELEQLAKKLAEQKECVNAELYTYLGLKAEEFFPSEELRKSAMSLYSKADQCAISAESTPNASANNSSALTVNAKYVLKARFRLGLLSLLGNDCAQAQKAFSRLTKGENDYSTRAFYWTAYCAKSDSKKEEFLSNFDELFRTNPLGFHTLSINHGSSLLIENLSHPIDPIVKTRTSVTQYNLWLSAIENFDKMGEPESVKKLLAPIRKNPDYLTQLEPGVRLYLSTFAFRAKDTMSLFRILDSVFRTQSEYVVDSTLKLFYPMKYLSFIAETSKRVNPFLITALIRQESAFQEEAHSKVGAVGLMQLMPRTAHLMDHSVTRKKLYQPEVNLRIGIKYFETLVDRFQGDVELALAAYNAGPEVVDRWAKRYPMKNRLLFLDLIPYSETRNYVTLIGRNYYWYTKLYAGTIQPQAAIVQTGDVVQPVPVVTKIDPAHPSSFDRTSEFQSLKSE